MSATLKPHLEPERPPRPESQAHSERNERQDDDLQMIDTSPTAVDEREVEAPNPAAAAGSAMIVFEDVRKVYEPHVTALDGVSFTIDKGEFVFVVGASGSGAA
jgi:ABC-type multidrug transport system fused ATPase/permease subunit